NSWTVRRGMRYGNGDRQSEGAGGEAGARGQVRRRRVLGRRGMLRRDDLAADRVGNAIAVGVDYHPSDRERIEQWRSSLRRRRGPLKREGSRRGGEKSELSRERRCCQILKKQDPVESSTGSCETRMFAVLFPVGRRTALLRQGRQLRRI